MRMELQEDFREVEDEVQAFAAKHVAPHAALIDREECIPNEVIASLAKSGLLASGLPEKLGGRLGTDQNPVAAAIAHGLLHEALGAASASVQGLANVQHMAGSTIARWGTPRSKGRLGAPTGGR